VKLGSSPAPVHVIHDVERGTGNLVVRAKAVNMCDRKVDSLQGRRTCPSRLTACAPGADVAACVVVGRNAPA
jgi:hypothetical protein